MTPETMTVISGVVLLLVFALVGWVVRRRGSGGDKRAALPTPVGNPPRDLNLK